MYEKVKRLIIKKIKTTIKLRNTLICLLTLVSGISVFLMGNESFEKFCSVQMFSMFSFNEFVCFCLIHFRVTLGKRDRREQKESLVHRFPFSVIFKSHLT